MILPHKENEIQKDSWRQPGAKSTIKGEEYRDRYCSAFAGHNSCFSYQFIVSVLSLSQSCVVCMYQYPHGWVDRRRVFMGAKASQYAWKLENWSRLRTAILNSILIYYVTAWIPQLCLQPCMQVRHYAVAKNAVKKQTGRLNPHKNHCTDALAVCTNSFGSWIIRICCRAI